MIPRQAARQPVYANPQVRKHRPDYGLVIIATILLGIGMVVMYAISPALAAQGGGASDNYFVIRQFVAIIFGLVAFFISAKISLDYWIRMQKPLVIIALILCVVTVFMGGVGNRWIHLNIFSMQPVELVKFALIISGAYIMAKSVREGNVSKLSVLRPLLIGLVIFSLILVVLQRDLGSTFVLIFMVGVMAFVAGLPLRKLLIIGSVAIIAGTLAISSTAYRRERLVTYLQPEKDCVDSGYHACQALIAVGSGGVFGVGLGHSVQAYGYLPEAANDSIFAIYAEKFGFVGVIALLMLFGSLLLRILNIMQRAPNKTMQLVCAGVFAWLGFQSLINIGAMVGLLPLKGITLPFISYGGTSLIFVMAGLGIVFQISSYTSMRKSSISFDEERNNNESDNHWRRNSRPRYTITRSSR
ncbi:MAG: putative peptidoglycan glycosyltransferase FtsW [Candidatus Saccharibacteria bacterium]